MKRIKKALLSLAFAIVSLLSFTSCATPADAQVVVSASVTPEIIIAEGIPYFIDGVLSYYIYRDRYWYPHYHNGYYRFIPYDRSIARHHPPVHRPHHGFGPRPPHRGPAIGHHPHNPGHVGPRPPRPHSGSPRGHFGGRRN